MARRFGRWIKDLCSYLLVDSESHWAIVSGAVCPSQAVRWEAYSKGGVLKRTLYMGMLDKLLGRGPEPLLGIDISSSAIKLLELRRAGSRYEVCAFAIEGLPPAAVVDKQINEPESVGEAIAKAVQRAGTKTKRAAVAVAGSSVITKTITMPASLSEADMEEQIKVEADQYIPYSIDDVNLDFQILGPTENTDETVDVLLAACRKDTVESRISVLELGGLKPAIVDIEAFVLENACEVLKPQMPDQGRGRTVAVVDVGSSGTSTIILQDGEVVHTRDQQFGGRQLTEDIMRHYGMSWEEAGKAKRFGNLPEDYHDSVLAPFVEDMAQQIDRGLQFYFASSGEAQRIDQILLAGGCAGIPGVDTTISERLDIPTAIAQPFADMTVMSRAKPQLVERDATSMLLACGLALRAFDTP